MSIGAIGTVSVTGVSGKDEDPLAFTATALGSTYGISALHFDGWDIGLRETTSEAINQIWIDPLNDKIYLTTSTAFTVTGLTRDGSDVFICTRGTPGDNTSCTYASF